MKFVIIAALLVNVALIRAASICAEDESCQLPDCRCMSTVLDPEIDLEHTPQLVMLTYDDAVTDQIYNEVMPFFENIVNPDGCNAGVTFYVSHEYTDYTKVHSLWANNHEVALHSITHSPYTDYWKSISYENMTHEFVDQREIMAHFANIDPDSMKGIRIPLFELSGDTSFEMMAEHGFTYDSSWPTQKDSAPGLWPYTLDYVSQQDCAIGVCPSTPIPGVWVMPILDWVDIEGISCAMVDACRTIPTSKEETLEWMKSNFHRVYDSNRAPFGVYLHAAFFFKNDNYLPAYKEFVEYMNSLPDVYIVTASNALKYVQNPKPLSVVASDVAAEPEIEDYEERIAYRAEARRESPISKGFIYEDECPAIKEIECVKRLCELTRNDIMEQRWMTSCRACPSSYPWLYNPYGDDPIGGPIIEEPEPEDE